MPVIFRDEFERKAHDVISIMKHGSPGGNARAEEVRRVADYLRGGPLATSRITEVGVKPPVPVVVTRTVFPKPLVVPAPLKLPQP